MLEIVKKKYIVDETYRMIAEDLLSHQYSIGTKIEPIRVLAKKYNVSYLTAQKAIKAFQIQGTLGARPGDGVYVTGKVKPFHGSIVNFLEDNDGTVSGKSSFGHTGTYTIAVVMPFWISERGESQIYSMIKGILAASDKHHWSIELIHNSGDISSHESAHPEFINKIESRRPDGVVWLQPILAHKMNIMRLIDRGHKVVVTGRHFHDVPAACIQMDLDDLAEKTIDYLRENGSDKIAMLSGPIEDQFKDPHSVDVVEAMRKAMDCKGVSFSYDRICQIAFSRSDCLIIHSFMEKHPEINGIICLHEARILEELEKMDQTGFFKKSINMVNTSGIYYQGRYDQLTHFNMVNVAWPLENIGRAVIREFEKEWLEGPHGAPLDLSVKIMTNSTR